MLSCKTSVLETKGNNFVTQNTGQRSSSDYEIVVCYTEYNDSDGKFHLLSNPNNSSGKDSNERAASPFKHLERKIVRG